MEESRTANGHDESDRIPDGLLHSGLQPSAQMTAGVFICATTDRWAAVDQREAGWYDLEYIGESEKGNSIVSFAVFQTKDEDEDDDGNVSRTVVPFQIAYAVSIHKAQGLEYTSVKLVITDEVDELITHNIFYTAITRTQNLLKIYWTPEVEAKVLKRIKPRNIDSDIELLTEYLGKPEPEFPF